jgi:hypothetical protein
MNNESISLSEARKIAEKNASKDCGQSLIEAEQILKNQYLEAENCWMFFGNEKTKTASENNLGIKWAHVVSKNGDYSMVQDFSDDPSKLHAYLKTMSNYFKK